MPLLREGVLVARRRSVQTWVVTSPPCSSVSRSARLRFPQICNQRSLMCALQRLLHLHTIKGSLSSPPKLDSLYSLNPFSKLNTDLNVGVSPNTHLPPFQSKQPLTTTAKHHFNSHLLMYYHYPSIIINNSVFPQHK